MYSFPNLEPVCCSMSCSNCCFLTCIQISQEAGKVVWYSHLFKNCPQFVVIHKIKGFGVVNKAEVDFFLEFSCFFCDPTDVGNLISGSSAFSKSPWTSGSSQFTHLEPDILEWEVEWGLGRITTNKAGGGDGIPVELFQILKDYSVKWCTQYASKFGNLSSGHRTG